MFSTDFLGTDRRKDQAQPPRKDLEVTLSLAYQDTLYSK